MLIYVIQNVFYDFIRSKHLMKMSISGIKRELLKVEYFICVCLFCLVYNIHTLVGNTTVVYLIEDNLAKCTYCLCFG